MEFNSGFKGLTLTFLSFTPWPLQTPGKTAWLHTEYDVGWAHRRSGTCRYEVSTVTAENQTMIPLTSSPATIPDSCISEVRDLNLYSENGYAENVARVFPVILIIAAHLSQLTKLQATAITPRSMRRHAKRVPSLTDRSSLASAHTKGTAVHFLLELRTA